MQTSLAHCTAAARLDAALPTIYNRMHLAAGRLLRHTPWSCEIEPHELVHEAYLKLHHTAAYQHARDQQHLLALSVRIMRQILVDYIRRQTRQKRGGLLERVSFDQTFADSSIDPSVILNIHHALTRLSKHDKRMAQVVEYRFFGHLTMDEIAVALDISERTAARLWRRARAYLMVLLSTDPAPTAEAEAVEMTAASPCMTL